MNLGKIINIALLNFFILSCNKKSSVIDSISNKKTDFQNRISRVNTIKFPLNSEKYVKCIKIDTIPITKLPYSFKYIYDSISTQNKNIDSFLKKKLIDENSKLNNLFSDSTYFSSKETLNIVKYIKFPYLGNAYFFKKLPNLNEIKLLLFIYENKNHDYNLPYLELQTFNKDNKNIDKLIVAGAREYECSWDRSFSIDKNYLITISNIESCYDIEEEKEIDKKEYLIKYKINEKGIFEIIQNTDVYNKYE